MRGWLAGGMAALVPFAPMTLPGSARGQARESAAPEISNLTIDPPFASPGGVARYASEQRGTTNLYELRVTDRAGRKSNALSVSLEVRL